MSYQRNLSLNPVSRQLELCNRFIFGMAYVSSFTVDPLEMDRFLIQARKNAKRQFLVFLFHSDVLLLLF